MKIKYNPSPIYNLLLISAIIYTGIFNIVSLPLISTSSFENLFTFALAVMLFLNALSNTSIRQKTNLYSAYFYAVLAYVALFIILHCFYAYITYDEGIRDLFATARQIFNLVFFIPYIYIIHSQGGYERLLKDITIITLVLLFAKTLKALAYNFTGRLIMDSLTYGFRHDRLRSGLPAFGGIAFIYCIYKVMELPKRTKEYYIHLAIVVFMLFYEYYVNMTRMYIVAFIATLFAMVVFKKRPKGKKLLVISVAVIVIVSLYFSGVLNDFIASFSESDEELGSSTTARNDAVLYFKTITAKNPIFGMGFLAPNTPSRELIMFGPNLSASLDDIGVRNMYYHYGVLGIILAVMVLGRMLYCAVMALAAKSSHSPIILGSLVYLLCTAVSLCIFDPQRILCLPLYWAIFEYEYYINVGANKHKKRRKTSIRIRGAKIGK